VVVSYRILYSKAARIDAIKLTAAKLAGKAKALIEILKNNPYQNPPPYEKLVGNLAGVYSRRINIQHRLVYEVREEDKTVRVLRMWTHYE
jgi:Txe/YoeB family toxin of toxin-antitoxin system